MGVCVCMRGCVRVNTIRATEEEEVEGRGGSCPSPRGRRKRAFADRNKNQQIWRSLRLVPGTGIDPSRPVPRTKRGLRRVLILRWSYNLFLRVYLFICFLSTLFSLSTKVGLKAGDGNGSV